MPSSTVLVAFFVALGHGCAAEASEVMQLSGNQVDWAECTGVGCPEQLCPDGCAVPAHPKQVAFSNDPSTWMAAAQANAAAEVSERVNEAEREESGQRTTFDEGEHQQLIGELQSEGSSIQQEIPRAKSFVMKAARELTELAQSEPRLSKETQHIREEAQRLDAQSSRLLKGVEGDAMLGEARDPLADPNLRNLIGKVRKADAAILQRSVIEARERVDRAEAASASHDQKVAKASVDLGKAEKVALEAHNEAAMEMSGEEDAEKMARSLAHEAGQLSRSVKLESDNEIPLADMADTQVSLGESMVMDSRGADDDAQDSMFTDPGDDEHIASRFGRNEASTQRKEKKYTQNLKRQQGRLHSLLQAEQKLRHGADGLRAAAETAVKEEEAAEAQARKLKQISGHRKEHRTSVELGEAKDDAALAAYEAQQAERRSIMDQIKEEDKLKQAAAVEQAVLEESTRLKKGRAALRASTRPSKKSSKNRKDLVHNLKKVEMLSERTEGEEGTASTELDSAASRALELATEVAESAAKV